MRLLLPAALLTLAGCALSSHRAVPSTLGTARRSAELLALLDVPGPVVVETVNSADWTVNRGGLVNLKHEKAQAAGLTDGDEPIQVYFHALRHPAKGLYVVDTGVERALRDAPKDAAVAGLVADEMHLEKMTVHAPLGDWLAKQAEPLKGVFLTHLHVDHITGMPDAPASAVVYTGPGETSARALLNLVVQGATDRALKGKPPVQEWQFAADADGRFDGVVDIFGDGSVWALFVPGHTPGSTAYVARTPDGPVLLTGDTCHTRWGWDNGVEPGEFTQDRLLNATNLQRLRTLSAEHPAMQVRLGHQR